MIIRPLLLSLIFCEFAHAQVIKIPSESGFSGFVLGGVGGDNYKSNMFKGPGNNNSENSGLNSSPDSHSSLIPIYGIDLRYTLSDTNTQFVFGNLIQDAVQFDFTQQMGIRQQIYDKGILSIAYVFPLMPNETWTDPYAKGKRNETDMKSSGGRLSWEKIWGYPLNISYTGRHFDVQNERSGQDLNLSASDRTLLNRNGNTHDVALSYDWLFSPGHLIHPQVSYKRADLDGRAMSYDKVTLELSYGYTNHKWSVATNIFAGVLKYDEINPIFNSYSDGKDYGVNSTFFLHEIAGISNLNSFVTASYNKYDSDIGFYDSYVKSISMGFIYNF